ncbi:Uu.00g013480.m01.CDS01, partial [Anthostomella pinea]
MATFAVMKPTGATRTPEPKRRLQTTNVVDRIPPPQSVRLCKKILDAIEEGNLDDSPKQKCMLLRTEMRAHNIHDREPTASYLVEKALGPNPEANIRLTGMVMQDKTMTRQTGISSARSIRHCYDPFHTNALDQLTADLSILAPREAEGYLRLAKVLRLLIKARLAVSTYQQGIHIISQ